MIGVNWLLANCRGPQGQLLQETEGTASRSYEERSSGAMAQVVHNATRLDWDSGKGKTAGRLGLQGQSKGSTGGWKGGSKGGSKGDGPWSGGGQWQGWNSWQGWNWNSY